MRYCQQINCFDVSFHFAATFCIFASFGVLKLLVELSAVDKETLSEVLSVSDNGLFCFSPNESYLAKAALILTKFHNPSS